MNYQLRIPLYFLAGAVGAMLLAPLVIALLRKSHARQTVLGYVVQHEHKSGTPTMGGFIFLVPAVVLAAAEHTDFALVATALAAGYGVLGFLDDFIKIKFSRNLGLKPYQKIIGQLGLAAIAGYFCYASPYVDGMLHIPFAGSVGLGWGIIPLTMLLFVACSNSVNLTDGLDGLAAYSSAGYFAVFAVVLYFAFGDAERSDYGEQLASLAAVSAGLVGALLGYTVFNANPAKVMMGDTGSLALGGMASAVAAFSGYTLLVDERSPRVPDVAFPPPPRDERLVGGEDMRALSRAHARGGRCRRHSCEGVIWSYTERKSSFTARESADFRRGNSCASTAATR